MMAPIAPTAPPGIAPRSIADRRSVPAEHVVTAPLVAAPTGTASAPAGGRKDLGDAVNTEPLD